MAAGESCSTLAERARSSPRTFPRWEFDLKRLDFVILTHRHNDHTAGLNHVLRQNSAVTIYTPIEGAGFNSLTRLR